MDAVHAQAYRQGPFRIHCFPCMGKSSAAGHCRPPSLGRHVWRLLADAARKQNASGRKRHRAEMRNLWAFYWLRLT